MKRLSVVYIILVRFNGTKIGNEHSFFSFKSKQKNDLIKAGVLKILWLWYSSQAVASLIM